MNAGALLRLLAALAAFSAFAAAAGAPLLDAAGKKNAAALCRTALSPSCHQKPERSFSLAGGKMALCARCAAIYAAIPVMLLALAAFWPRPEVNRAFARAVLLLAPVALDGALQALGLYDAPLLRAATGASGGAGIALVWHVLFTEPPTGRAHAPRQACGV